MYFYLQTNKVEWNNKEMHEYSFNFLFNKFKKYYLHVIFPNFSTDTSIYDPKLGKWNQSR